MAQTDVRAGTGLHPLEPLGPDEIDLATEVLRTQEGLADTYRFVSVTLKEPPKEAVLAGSSDGVEREAQAVLLNRADGATYEAVVSLSARAVRSFRAVPGSQAQVILDEFFECEEILRQDPEYQAAVRKRGITEFDRLMVDPWSAGNYGDEPPGRVLRALAWVRLDGPDDNGYAHPIENLVAYVDLTQKKVARIEDYGVVPVPRTPGNYTEEEVGPVREDLRPVEITQPEGPSFTVHGHEVAWQNWRFRLGFTPREGLVFHTVSYEDGGRRRPVLYRASLAEMVVPYGDPRPAHRRKNAFDAGEYNIGCLTNSLELGCDCLGEIRYFDATLAGSDGKAYRLANAVCMHEEDVGMLWKHTDFRTEKTEVRRSRRLVVSFVATVGNYEYGFFWYFYQDGTIEVQVKLTGIVSTGAVEPGRRPEHGQLLNADGLYAPNHQHFFNFRLDFDVDGQRNSIYEVHTEADPPGEGNELGHAFRSIATPLRSESEAQQLIDPLAARSWRVVNPTSRNGVGEPVGYRLVPHDNVRAFAHPDASVTTRAGFITRHLWVTPFNQEERYAAGEYPNQHPGGDGLPAWTAADRSVEDTDIVVWYTLGSHHTPRVEDWPVMPVQYTGFKLMPDGFFDRNPGLDVPRPAPACGH